MAITQAVCNSFKVEILKGLHDFTATTGNAFKLALYETKQLYQINYCFSTNDEVASLLMQRGGALTLYQLYRVILLFVILMTYHLQVQLSLHKLLLFITALLCLD